MANVWIGVKYVTYRMTATIIVMRHLNVVRSLLSLFPQRILIFMRFVSDIAYMILEIGIGVQKAGCW